MARVHIYDLLPVRRHSAELPSGLTRTLLAYGRLYIIALEVTTLAGLIGRKQCQLKSMRLKTLPNLATHHSA